VDDYEFEGQRPGEQVEVLVRTHPMRFMWPGIKTLLIFLVPVAIYLFFGLNLYASIFIIAFIVWGITEIVEEWYEYTNDICLITNMRIISIDQKGYFKRQIAEAELDKIQEAEYSTKGPLQTMFNFGDIKLQTASSSSHLVLQNVPRPYEVQQEITKRIRVTKPISS
jgi:membrane protein YdbS with pleckstrin-like domain